MKCRHSFHCVDATVPCCDLFLIPNTSLYTANSAGVGKIFVQFFDVAGAEAANRQLSGRKFDGRVVLTSYLDEAKYANKQFE